MFPEVRAVNGRKLVPQLGIGCFFFTLIGLLLTYGIATYVTTQMQKHPSASSPAAREAQDR